MIEHVYRRAMDARTVDAVLVATDDERNASAVDAFGGTAVMTRADHRTGTDRLAEVAAFLTSELIVNIQGDLPFIAPEPIDSAVALVRDHPELSMGTLRKLITEPADLAAPSTVKVVVDREGNALYFSRAPLPYLQHGHETPRYWKHIGLYVYRRQFLLQMAALAPTPLEQAESLEQLRVLEHGFTIGTVETTIDTIEVNTPEDLERARRQLEPSARA